MILDSPTKILQLIASATCDVTVSGYVNDTGRPSFSEETKATASTQTICLAPGRLPKVIEHTSVKTTGGANTLTVQIYDSSGSTKTTQQIHAVLAADERLGYDADGWYVTDANGTTKVGTAGWVIAAGKIGTLSNSLTFAGTDGSTLNIGTGGTLGTSAYVTLGANVATWLATPTSANLFAAVATTTTGSGSLVGHDSPTLVTPTLGVAAATSINKVAITAPATSATLTIADGKTLTASNTLTLTATDGSTLAIGTGGTLGTAAYTASTAYEAAGAIATHAALQTGVHGLAITAGKTLTVLKSMSFTAADDTGVYTFPTGTASIARTNDTNTFSGTQTFSGTIVSPAGTVTLPGTIYAAAETGTGFYRIGANDVGFSVSGTYIAGFDSTGFKTQKIITSTLVGNNIINNNSLGTTGGRLAHLGATGTDMYIAVAGSTGGGLITASSAYDLQLRNDTGIGFGIGTAMVGRFGSAGLAITGTLSSTGVLSVTDATDASSATVASLKTAGGIASVKGQWIGGTSRLVGAVTMDSTLSLSLTSTQGIKLADRAITGTVYIGRTAAGAFGGNGADIGIQQADTNSGNILINAFNDGTTTNGNILLQSNRSTKLFIGRDGYIGAGTDTPISLTEIRGGLTTVGAVLTLGTKEPSVVANDVLGRVNFYAPLDAAGSDANLLAASIVAVSEGTFSATSNATKLSFRTGASEAATEKMSISSTGAVLMTSTLGVTGALTTNGGLQTFLANDSAGAGFRYVVVPNA